MRDDLWRRYLRRCAQYSACCCLRCGRFLATCRRQQAREPAAGTREVRAHRRQWPRTAPVGTAPSFPTLTGLLGGGSIPSCFNTRRPSAVFFISLTRLSLSRFAISFSIRDMNAFCIGLRGRGHSARLAHFQRTPLEAPARQGALPRAAPGARAHAPGAPAPQQTFAGAVQAVPCAAAALHSHSRSHSRRIRPCR